MRAIFSIGRGNFRDMDGTKIMREKMIGGSIN
jgi:hypothetical protein